MFSNRFLRLLAAGILTVAVFWTMLPHATSYISTSAVVNAPLLSVKSPIDGRIEMASVGAAEAVIPGQRMVSIQAERRDRELLHELLAREQSLAAEIEAKGRQEHALTALRSGLAERARRYQVELTAWLETQTAEQEAELAAAHATLDETAERIGRSRALAGEGTLALANLKSGEAELARARAEVMLAEARLAANGRELASLAQGVLVDQGSSDVSYSQQRIDELDFRLNELMAEHASLDAEHKAIAARIEDARRENADRESFTPLASARGVVWRASGAPGTAVLTGDEVMQVLDCERRFIEVAVSERLFDSIQPGGVAWVQFRGSSTRFKATVAAVRGSGGKFANAQLAAETPLIAEGQLRVLVPLQTAADGVVPASGGDAAFCDVGRTAEVRFDRPFTRDILSAAEVFAGIGERVRSWFAGPGLQTASAARAGE